MIIDGGGPNRPFRQNWLAVFGLLLIAGAAAINLFKPNHSLFFYDAVLVVGTVLAMATWRSLLAHDYLGGRYARERMIIIILAIPSLMGVWVGGMILSFKPFLAVSQILVIVFALWLITIFRRFEHPFRRFIR